MKVSKNPSEKDFQPFNIIISIESGYDLDNFRYIIENTIGIKPRGVGLLLDTLKEIIER